MPTRKLNFSAGPSKLPEQVLLKLNSQMMEYQSSGVGICELGHRTSYFQDVINEAKALFTELLGLSDAYDVMFMTGGATAQFSAIPLNLVTDKQNKAGYIISGHWSKAALEEANKYCSAISLCSTEDFGFRKLPELSIIPKDLSYVHYTSNNTIFGTQFETEPEVAGLPLICDASSDILSRKIDISKYSLIYAGAQKNLGTPGVTIVIIKKELLLNSNNQLRNSIPKILDYQTYLNNNSLYNTPPVFPIFSVLETLKWIKNNGKLSEIEEKNSQKASLIYHFLDNSRIYEPYISRENQTSRSRMNVVFNLKDRTLEKECHDYLKSAGILGLEGHRSVGGFRASLYNAIEISEVKTLIECLGKFELTH